MRHRRSHDPAFEASKYARDGVTVGDRPTVAGYKVYANPQELIRLPAVRRSGGHGVWESLAGARGLSEGGEVSQGELAQVLWAAAGMAEGGSRAHSVPAPTSALETYVLTRRVRDLSSGSYHYEPRGHALEQLSNGDPTSELGSALLGVDDIDPYAAALVVTGVPQRWRPAFGPRTHRLLALEAGSAVQAATVAAEALGLASRLVACFFDDEVSQLLRLDAATEPPLAVLLLGR
jgi:SagB-type dehydrogenase family enzyme